MLFLVFTACNSGEKQQNNIKSPAMKSYPNSTAIANANAAPEPIPGHPARLPDAESLISVVNVGAGLNIDHNALHQNCGLTGPERLDSYCFYKWDSSFDNSGIIIQISRNPMHTEYADWANARIMTLLETGEMAIGDTEPAKFEPYREVGDGGAWSYQAGKYYWRIKMDYIIMIAYNTDFPVEQQYETATNIAKEIMKQFT